LAKICKLDMRVYQQMIKPSFTRRCFNRGGCEQIYKDTISGAKTKRVGLSDASAYSREGDTIVVWRLDRLSRSLKDLIEIAAVLETKGIGLKVCMKQSTQTQVQVNLFSTFLAH
jgi:DNA invertase Pin-like site-specific DNA recombinase